MGATTMLALGGCSTNPATGKTQLNMLSESQEVSIGNEAAPQFIEQGGGKVPDAGVQAYVSSVGMKLAASSERADLPWEFFTLNSPIINAFALPGGKVFITRGLMEKLSNEAELAAVLGHEVGHVTAQHIGQRMSQAKILEIGLQVVGAVSEQSWIDTALGTGGNLYLLKYGRDQESQSDALGLRYMTQNGYDPRAMLGVMQVLQEAGGGNGIEMLQTHPLPQTRIDRVSDMINKDYAQTLNDPKYTLQPTPYQQQALTPLKKLPPAPEPKAG
jgi:predicted Zn-dependent protease